MLRQAVGSVLAQSYRPIEIIIVDDGSTDATAAIAEQTPHVRTIRHKSNLGRGAAILTGIREARGNIICMQDADGEQAPADLPRLVEPILAGKARVVYGSRFQKKTQAAQTTILRQTGNRFFAWMARIFFKQHLTDVYTGAKCFERSIFDEIHLQSTGFEQEAELLAKISRLNSRIYEIPVVYRARKTDTSKMKLKDGLIGFYTLIKYALICRN